ncbi:MAG: hypothetical protein ACKVKF_04915, partial [Rhodobacterales bacterium]
MPDPYSVVTAIFRILVTSSPVRVRAATLVAHGPGRDMGCFAGGPSGHFPTGLAVLFGCARRQAARHLWTA